MWCNDEDGYFSDWVELINTTDEDISLKGYCLTDDVFQPYRFTLPDIILEKHSTLLIFLDGKDTLGAQYIHANFSISPDDGTLNLFDNEHRLIDTAEIVGTDETVSYGRDDGDMDTWQYFRIPTPGAPNIFEGAEEKEALFLDYPKYVRINEVKSIGGGQGVYGDVDWIELYNNSEKTIDLSGFGLSDSRKDCYKWVFPKGASLEPNGYMLILATGENTVDAEGNYRTNFKLNAGLEEIYLSSNLGYIVDNMPARYIDHGDSFGKTAAGESCLMGKPTPGEVNTKNSFSGYAHSVIYSYMPGVYAESISLTLFCDEDASEIYYTLDGSNPTINSLRYTEAIPITKDITVSAVAAVLGKLNSKVSVQSYILERKHDLATVVITCEPEFLTGSEGLYHHPDRDRRVPAKIEIIEPNQGGYICFDAQIGLFGNSSLYAPQKSFAVDVENAYGNDCIAYDLFPGDTKTASVFGSFVLRNGGSNEWNRTKLTDAFLMSLARLGMNVDAQSYRPCAVYINGEYYGLLNIREKLNRCYIETKYGYEREEITIVEPATNGDYTAVQGSVDEFMALVTYIRKHDLSNQKNYEYIAARLDIDNYIDSVLAHIISGNKDTGNIKFWKADGEGEKWRVFLFDLDRAAYYPTVNHLEQRTSPEGHGSGNLFDTSVIRGLLKNDTFSYHFYKRAIELIDTLYSPEFSTAYYDMLAKNIEHEMGNNLDLWWEYAYNDAGGASEFGNAPDNRATAERFILHEQDRHRTFLKNRKSYMLEFFKSYFGLSDGDIERIRREIEEENKAPTQIYDAFKATGSIEQAVSLAYQIQTVERNKPD